MSARVVPFTLGDRPGTLNVSSPDADWLFDVVDKLRELRHRQPVAAAVIERTIDDMLGPPAGRGAERRNL